MLNRVLRWSACRLARPLAKQGSSLSGLARRRNCRPRARSATVVSTAPGGSGAGANTWRKRLIRAVQGRARRAGRGGGGRGGGGGTGRHGASRPPVLATASACQAGARKRLCRGPERRCGVRDGRCVPRGILRWWPPSPMSRAAPRSASPPPAPCSAAAPAAPHLARHRERVRATPKRSATASMRSAPWRATRLPHHRLHASARQASTP